MLASENLMQHGVDRRTLELLGKQASDTHLRDGSTMTAAVVSAVQDRNDLNDEHVQRITEFANNATFSRLFKTARGDHKFVSIDGGPADSAKVLEELRGPPREVVMKTANRAYTKGLDGYDLFHGDDFQAPMAKEAAAIDVEQEFRDYAVLQGAVERARQDCARHSLRYGAAVDELCKQAMAVLYDGGSTADVATAIHGISPHADFTKLALGHLSTQLAEVPMPNVRTKVASGALNADHPLCTAFEGMIKAAMDYYKHAIVAERLEQAETAASIVIKELV